MHLSVSAGSDGLGILMSPEEGNWSGTEDATASLPGEVLGSGLPSLFGMDKHVFSLEVSGDNRPAPSGLGQPLP